MVKLYAFFQSFVATARDREEGQTMAEYAVILAVIIVAVVATLIALGTGIKGTLTKVTSNL